MIKLKDITFSYKKGKNIIKDFSYEFEDGKSYVICGDNGHGKTTLLKLILGLLKPDTGIIMKNEDYTIGYVPDYNGLYENLSLMDNVLFRLGIYNKIFADVENQFKKWSAEYGLTQYKDAYIRDLSLGTKKKLRCFALY